MRRNCLLATACLVALVLASGSDGQARGASSTAPSGELAFVRGDLFKSGHIWSADSSGALRQLTSGRMEVDPSWSPNGRRLAYVGYSHTKSGAAARTDLYVLELATGLRRRLTNDSALDRSPSWSPDGTRIVYTANGLRSNGRDLMIVKATGGEPRRLLSTYRYEGGPHWAPKGERILFLSNIGDAYLIRSDGTGERRILRNVEAADWSPDGTAIDFTRDGLYRARLDGTKARLLTTVVKSNPVWSPDGATLAIDGDARDYCGAAEYKPVIVLVPLHPPGPARARACTEADEFSPAWRPTP